jgi:hypothetical protein
MANTKKQDLIAALALALGGEADKANAAEAIADLIAQAVAEVLENDLVLAGKIKTGIEKVV